jgi:hypothetical protein
MFITCVSVHWPTSVPGHVEADTLSKISAGRIHPLGVSWLSETLGHVGALPMAAIGLQLEVTTTIAEVQEACKASSKCAAECPHDIVSLENIDKGPKPLHDWQVNYVGPLPRSTGK